MLQKLCCAEHHLGNISLGRSVHLLIILVLILLLFLPAKMGGNTHTHLLKQKRLVDFTEVA